MRGAWAPAKGRGSSARRVEMGGVGEENDGMLKVVEGRRRWAKWIRCSGRTEKEKRKCGARRLPCHRTSERKSGPSDIIIEIIIDFAPTADPASPMT